MSSFHGTFRLRQFNRPLLSVDVLINRAGIPGTVDFSHAEELPRPLIVCQIGVRLYPPLVWMKSLCCISYKL